MSSLLALQPFEKNFYMEHPAVTALSPEEVAAYRAEHSIDVTDSRAPKPVRTFLEAAFPEYLVAELEASGFRKPTAIQSQGWPIAMKGLDLKAHPWVKTEDTMACQREGVLKLKGSEEAEEEPGGDDGTVVRKKYFAPRLTFRNQVETIVEDMWYALYAIANAPPIVCRSVSTLSFE